MNNILEEFYYGNINPVDQRFERQSEFGRAMKVLSDRESEIFALLNEKEKEVLQQFINAQVEINSLTAKTKFMHGFKLGFQIAVEAMKEVAINEC